MKKGNICQNYQLMAVTVEFPLSCKQTNDGNQTISELMFSEFKSFNEQRQEIFIKIE